jgi:tetratricopeptide (TPR) repeat protein
MNLTKLCFLVLTSAFAFLSATAQPQQKTPPPSATQPAQSSGSSQQRGEAKQPDRAAAYYHYGMAHMYEEMMAMYGRSEYATKAIEEYRKAIEADPSSEYLTAALAELYSRTGRIRDAVLEAQEIIQRDPNNLEAHKLLGRIYLSSLRDSQGGTQSREVLRLAIEQYEALVRIEPKNSEDHLLLGGLYIINRDLTKAEGELKAALAIDPESEEAITQLARLYADEGDNKKAVETLNSIPEGDRSSKVYSTLGSTYEQQKDYKNAIAAYQRALILDKDNLEAMHGLAQNLASDNQLEPALNAYKTLQGADPQDWQASVEVARIYRHLGKLDLALENLKKAEVLAPDQIDIPFEEAIVLEAQGKLDEAATLFQKLVTHSTTPNGEYTAEERHNRALFLERLGNIYRETGRPQLAVETFRKMVDLGGEEAARGYNDVIDLYREQKEWPEATRVAQEAVQKLPDDKGLKLALAQQMADEGKAEEAIQLARSVLKGDASDRDSYPAISQIYARLKRWKEAEDSLNEADRLSTRPEEKANVNYFRGILYDRQKKYDQAEQAFRQVLLQDPNNSSTLNNLGYMMADHNLHLEEALNMIKRALEFEPENGAYLDSLGWAYFKLGKYEEAEESLRKASDKTPNDATIQDHLGELYAKTGRLKLAVTHWERALDEWSKSVAADVDQQDVARVQKKVETTKVRLAQQKQ